MVIRRFDAEGDSADVAGLIRLTNPAATVTADSWRRFVTALPPSLELLSLVAVEADRVVGHAAAYRSPMTADAASVSVAVHPDRRQRGLGTALYEPCIQHALALAPLVLTEFFESEAGIQFAHRLGFEPARAEAVAALDPSTVDEPLPIELEVRPLRDVDPHVVFELDEETTVDMPHTGELERPPFEEWETLVWNHPLLMHEGSFVAVVDREAAALSLLLADLESGRATNMYTAVRRGFRGRGLALAVKLASTRWAAEHGVTRIVTRNDETNAAMLAVNRRLGYRPLGRHVEYVRPLAQATSIG
jgi:GNAT superfamily N-acetyltransferase